jgi:hypothetical protein
MAGAGRSRVAPLPVRASGSLRSATRRSSRSLRLSRCGEKLLSDSTACPGKRRTDCISIPIRLPRPGHKYRDEYQLGFKRIKHFPGFSLIVVDWVLLELACIRIVIPDLSPENIFARQVTENMYGIGLVIIAIDCNIRGYSTFYRLSCPPPKQNTFFVGLRPNKRMIPGLQYRFSVSSRFARSLQSLAHPSHGVGSRLYRAREPARAAWWDGRWFDSGRW